MAGAGIGKCIICGRDNQPLVSDICQDCTMDEFRAGLESSPLKAGQRVFSLKNGYKQFDERWEVANDFDGGWDDEVHLRFVLSDGRVSADPDRRFRKFITSK